MLDAVSDAVVDKELDFVSDLVCDSVAVSTCDCVSDCELVTDAEEVVVPEWEGVREGECVPRPIKPKAIIISMSDRGQFSIFAYAIRPRKAYRYLLLAFG